MRSVHSSPFPWSVKLHFFDRSGANNANNAAGRGREWVEDAGGDAAGGQRCRSKQDRAFSPIVLLGDLPLTYPYTAPAAGSNIPERLSANGVGRSEGRRPRAAGYVRGRAPDEMTGIRQDAPARRRGRRGGRGPGGRGMQVPGRHFPGGTDLPFPRRGGKKPRRARARRRGAAALGAGAAGHKKRSPGELLRPGIRRTAATYSPNWSVSTIGVSAFNFSVRNG